MDADQDDVFLAECCTARVYAAYALFERDVGEFGDDDFDVPVITCSYVALLSLLTFRNFPE